MITFDLCNISHLLSSKHQRLCSENVKCKNYIHSLITVDSCGSGAKSIPQKPTSKKSDVSTPKKTPINNIVHIDLHNEDAENNVIYHSSESGHVTIPIDSQVIAAYACKYCKRPYINRTGLWRHKKKYGSSCIVKVIESSKVENTEELKNMINTMIDMNQEFKTQILDLYKANAAAAAAARSGGVVRRRRLVVVVAGVASQSIFFSFFSSCHKSV